MTLLLHLTFIMQILLETGVKMTFEFGLTIIPVAAIDPFLWQEKWRCSFSPDEDSSWCSPCPCIWVSWIIIAVSWWWQKSSAIFICFTFFRSPWQLNVGNLLYLIFLLLYVQHCWRKDVTIRQGLRGLVVRFKWLRENLRLLFRRNNRILRKGLVCKSSSVASNQVI